MPACIFVADLTVIPAIILEANRRTELVYGYTATELVGKPTVHLVPEESRASVQNILQRAQQGERVTAETINQRRDGTIFPGRVVATLDPTDSGRMITDDCSNSRRQLGDAFAQAITVRRVK